MKLIRFAQVKAYIDYGRGLTSYFNELFLIFGTWSVFTEKGPLFIAALFFGYGLLTLIVGWAGFHFGLKDAETEVQNKYNLFVRQMRRKVRLNKKA